MDGDVVDDLRGRIVTFARDAHLQNLAVVDVGVVGEKGERTSLLVEFGDHIHVRLMTVLGEATRHTARFVGVSNLGRVSPLGCAQVVHELRSRRRGLDRASRSAISALGEGEHILAAGLVHLLQAGSVLSRVSIPLLAAIAVVKEVESILRGVLGTALARAARSAQGRGLIEEGKRAFNRCTSVTLSAARTFLAALRTSYATRKYKVSKGLGVILGV